MNKKDHANYEYADSIEARFQLIASINDNIIESQKIISKKVDLLMDYFGLEIVKETTLPARVEKKKKTNAKVS